MILIDSIAILILDDKAVRDVCNVTSEVEDDMMVFLQGVPMGYCYKSHTQLDAPLIYPILYIAADLTCAFIQQSKLWAVIVQSSDG